MDLSKFIQKYPLLIEILKGHKYSKRTKYQYITICKRILVFQNQQDIESYEEIYDEILKQHKLNENTQIIFKRNFWRVVNYIENDIWFYEGDSRKNLSGAYSKLKGDFKKIIDSFVDYENKSGRLAPSTIYNLTSINSSFLLYFQNKGMCTFEEIANQDVIETAFLEIDSIRNSFDIVYKIRSFLRQCSLIYPSSEVYQIISNYLPEYPPHKKIVDFLNDEEKRKIEEILDSDELNYRTKAIARLAYDVGMRGIDIVNLKLDDVDTQRETIIFIQSKTQKPQIISFPSEVGNALCDYIEKERPHVVNDSIFLTEKKPYRPITKHTLYGVSEKIYNVAKVHMDPGRRKGLHLFRHAFATNLLEDNVESTVISCLLGHGSLKSIAPYLDADIEHLRDNALEISNFIDILKPVLQPYSSNLSSIFEEYRKEAIQKNNWNWRANLNLQVLDELHLKGAEEISSCFQKASLPLEDESYHNYFKRIIELKRIMRFFRRYDFKIEEIKLKENYKPNKRSPRLLREFKCCRNIEMYLSFISHCKSSNRWSKEIDSVLYKFDHFCYENGYETKIIDQDIIDKWCEVYVSKGEYGCQCVHNVNRLIIYINKIYGYNLNTVDVVIHKRRHYARKNSFSETELINFFFAVQHVSEQKYNPEGFYYANKLVAPNIFLLMYSSGMRPFECRTLDRSDVDLEHGIINIRKTKGYVEHRVAISYELRDVLKSYDENMDKILPNRKCFFPDKNDKYLSCVWMDRIFRKCWYMFNEENSNPYAFRHNYATTNINSWDNDKPEEFFKKLEYLSKSMGHAKLDCTIYYYSFTISQYLKMKETVSETFNEMVPDRISYFEDYENCQNQ